jgi:hypothetical protein
MDSYLPQYKPPFSILFGPILTLGHSFVYL